MNNTANRKHVGAWSLVVYLSVTFIISYMDRQMVFAIFPLLRSDLGFTDAQLGLAGSAFTWTYAIAMPLSGRLADVFPRDRLIISSLVVWSLATLGTGTSGTINQFLIWRVVMGLSEALYVPAAIRLMTERHTEKTRAKALAIHGFGQFTGITLGGWYGGWAGQHYGWRAGFLSMSIVGLVYGLVLVKALLGMEQQAPERSKMAPAAPAEILRSSPYLMLVTTYFVFCAMLWMLYAWLPNFIFERYHLSLADSGLTGTLYLQGSSAMGAILGGFFGDRFASRSSTGRFRVALAGLFISAPFAFLVFATDSLLVLKLSACAFGLFAGCFISNSYAAAFDTVSSQNFGLATGVMNMIGGLGSGTAILAAGLWKESLGIPAMTLFAAVVVMALTLVLWIVVERNLPVLLSRRTAVTAA